MLEPMLLPFLSRYPAISLDLVTDSRLIDIVAQGFDAGVRRRGSVPAEMARVSISGPMRFVVVGSPDYLAGRNIPAVPSDLLGHRSIRIRSSNGVVYPWEFCGPAGVQAIDVPGVLTLDDPSLMRHAALAGAGLAYLADWRVAGDVQDGRLLPALVDWAAEEDGLCLYHPSRKHPSAALRALIEMIRCSGAEPYQL